MYTFMNIYMNTCSRCPSAYNIYFLVMFLEYCGCRVTYQKTRIGTLNKNIEQFFKNILSLHQKWLT